MKGSNDGQHWKHSVCAVDRRVVVHSCGVLHKDRLVGVPSGWRDLLSHRLCAWHWHLVRVVLMARDQVALEILKAIVSADWKFVLVDGVETWDDKAIERSYELADKFIAFNKTKETEQ